MKLMIITSTPTLVAYGGVESLLRPTIEEHLLERISALEAELHGANERIELLLELVTTGRRRARAAPCRRP